MKLGIKPLILLLPFLFVGCSEEEEKPKEYITIETKVIEKKFIPSSKKSKLVPIISGKFVTYVHSTDYVPEQYLVTVEIPMIRVIEVTKEEYDKLNIGDSKIIQQEK